RDLGGVVQRARRQPVRRPRDLADRLVGKLDQGLVEEDRLDVPETLPLDFDVLLSREALRRLLRKREEAGELPGVEVPLVEQLLGGLDDGGDDAGPADDVSRRADGAVTDVARDRADLERELRRAGERIAPLVHRRRAGVRGLAAPGDTRALDPERAEDDAERQVERLEHRALLDVQLEVGTRVLELRAGLERGAERDAVAADGLR